LHPKAGSEGFLVLQTGMETYSFNLEKPKLGKPCFIEKMDLRMVCTCFHTPGCLCFYRFRSGKHQTAEYKIVKVPHGLKEKMNKPERGCGW
jgi:hypothetical protein